MTRLPDHRDPPCDGPARYADGRLPPPPASRRLAYWRFGAWCPLANNADAREQETGWQKHTTPAGCGGILEKPPLSV